MSETAWNEWMHLSRAWCSEVGLSQRCRSRAWWLERRVKPSRQSRRAHRGRRSYLRLATRRLRQAQALITTFPHWDRSACLYAPRTDNDNPRPLRDTVTRVLLDVLSEILSCCVDMWFAFRSYFRQFRILNTKFYTQGSSVSTFNITSNTSHPILCYKYLWMKFKLNLLTLNCTYKIILAMFFYVTSFYKCEFGE